MARTLKTTAVHAFLCGIFTQELALVPYRDRAVPMDSVPTGSQGVDVGLDEVPWREIGYAQVPFGGLE
jgi:hypothetical protein